tara:strand:+ start:1385 stop:2461 length:1077 start_codon:yes stop_codon:yes gene_type:complete
MAYSTINKSTDYFNTVTYSGNGSATQAITNTFQTDFSWIKDRGVTAAHTLQDAVRGFDVTKKLSSNSNDAENNASGATWGNYGGVTAVGATSFTTSLGSNTPYQTNANGSNYVSWNWKAGGGQGSSNTDGSTNTTYTSVNTTAGFSISSYAGSNSNATIGHGLGVAPKMIIIKNLSSAKDWVVYHTSTGNAKKLELNNTDAEANTGNFASTSPTSTVFTVAGDYVDVNQSGSNYVAYCFAEKTGYSKFGSYIGTGSATNSPFIYTGFKPTFVLIKSSSNSSTWHLADNKRIGYNPLNYRAQPNNNNAEYTGVEIYSDFLSNGFKLQNTDTDTNGTRTYIYMAFGQSLVGSNNIPATAR